MAKKLISVWLSLTILLFSSISIYAGDSVRGQFFLKNIYINGSQIFNYELNSPLFTYKGATYIPLTEGLNKALGLTAEMDWESRTLKLLNTEPAQTGVSDGKLQSNLQDVTCELASDITVIAYETVAPGVAVTTGGGVETETDADAVKTAEPEAQAEGTEENPATAETETETSIPQEGTDDGVPGAEAADAALAKAGEIVFPELKATKLNLGELPLLAKGNVIYFPAKVLTQHDLFGWSMYYDEYSGLYISTDKDVDAKATFNEPQSRYIKGLVNYVRKCNGNISVAYAQDLVSIFQHEARVYGVDHTLLMAMAHKESTFTATARGGSGSLGMMQVLPSTARACGVDPGELTNPHVSIQFGASYLKGQLDAFGGSITKALSAYNQGGGAVRRGSYSTAYANRILTAQSNLKNYLAEGGYGKGY